MAFKVRPSNLIVFDGQSLNLVPDLTLCFPVKMMATGITGTAWYNRGISATTWRERTADVAGRADALLSTVSGIKTLIDTAGTKNINQGMAAVDIFAEASAYWTARRAAGFDNIIACTVSPATDFAGAELTVLSDYNQLLRNAVGVELEAVADLDTIPEMNDAADAAGAVYFDGGGVHYTDAGTTLVAPVVRTAYLTVVPE